MSAGAVRALLSAHGLRAHRDLGQNFLVDDRVAARLVELAGVTERDLVIEIGTSRVSGTVTSGGEPLLNALVALRQLQGDESGSLPGSGPRGSRCH